MAMCRSSKPRADGVCSRIGSAMCLGSVLVPCRPNGMRLVLSSQVSVVSASLLPGRLITFTDACAMHAEKRIPFDLCSCFSGEFGDAFVQDTSLEGGHIGPAINTFARISNFVLEEFGATALTLFSEQDRTHVKYVLDKLKGAEVCSARCPRRSY
eukprot:2425511-Rhodomonas_salina.3